MSEAFVIKGTPPSSLTWDRNRHVSITILSHNAPWRANWFSPSPPLYGNFRARCFSVPREVCLYQNLKGKERELLKTVLGREESTFYHREFSEPAVFVTKGKLLSNMTYCYGWRIHVDPAVFVKVAKQHDMFLRLTYVDVTTFGALTLFFDWRKRVGKSETLPNASTKIFQKWQRSGMNKSRAFFITLNATTWEQQLYGRKLCCFPEFGNDFLALPGLNVAVHEFTSTPSSPSLSLASCTPGLQVRLVCCFMIDRGSSEGW